MTDEQKAEEYVKETFGERDWLVSETYKNIYLVGLAEGRKEEQEKTCYCKHIQNFEKENAELKNTNDKLIKEIQTGMIYRGLQEEIEELKAQIKKMKCCRNCKHFNQVEIHCDLYAKYECVNHDKWEVME